jgi:hypothetical protein
VTPTESDRPGQMSSRRTSGAAGLPPDIPAEALSYLQQIGYLDADRLKVGDPVKPMVLMPLDGDEPVFIPGEVRPTALVFASYT